MIRQTPRRDEVVQASEASPPAYSGRPAERERTAQANFGALMRAKAQRFGHVMSQGGMQTDPGGLKEPRR